MSGFDYFDNQLFGSWLLTQCNQKVSFRLLKEKNIFNKDSVSNIFKLKSYFCLFYRSIFYFCFMRLLFINLNHRSFLFFINWFGCFWSVSKLRQGMPNFTLSKGRGNYFVPVLLYPEFELFDVSRRTPLSPERGGERRGTGRLRGVTLLDITRTRLRELLTFHERPRASARALYIGTYGGCTTYSTSDSGGLELLRLENPTTARGSARLQIYRGSRRPWRRHPGTPLCQAPRNLIGAFGRVRNCARAAWLLSRIGRGARRDRCRRLWW